MKKIGFLLLAAPLFFFACSDDNTNDAVTDATQSISTDVTDGLHFEVAGGQTAVTVTSSSDWRLVGRKTWCKPSAEAGKSGDAITFTADPNFTEDDRTLTYSFVCGSKVSKIEVTQKGNNLLIVPQKAYKVSAEGESVSVKIRATVPVVRVISDAGKGWIRDVTTTEPTTDGGISYLKFQVSANSTYGDHSATISLQYGDGLSTTLTISQPQNDAILLDKAPAEYTFDENGGEFSVTVSANVEYAVNIAEVDQTWLSIKPKALPEMRALAEDTYTFVVTEAGSAARFTEVHFLSANGKIDTKLTVRQSGKPAPALLIPDTKLREYLQKNGYINVLTAPACEITEKGLAATTISLPRGSVRDLTGLNALTGLTTIDVQNNYLTSIDLTGLTKLTSLSCDSNPLTSITIDDEAPLEGFMLNMLRDQSNNYSYDIVIKGGNLKNLDISYTGKVKSIDISECPKVNYVDFTWNASGMKIYVKQGQLITTNGGMHKDASATLVYK